MTIKSDIQSLSPGAVVELFELDATNIPGGTISYFHAGTNELSKPVAWQSLTYSPLPIEATGFDITTNGTLPRPRFKVANVGGIFSAVARENEDLVGCKVTRRRTFAKYLDIENWIARIGTAQAGTANTLTLDSLASDINDFYIGQTLYLAGGAGSGQSRIITAYDGTTKVATVDSNWSSVPNSTTTFEVRHPEYSSATPDPNQHFPDDIWFVEQKLNENKYIVEWELASVFDLQGVMLPARQIIQDSCSWKYRGAECGYTGTAYFDLNDQPTTQSNDFCAKHLSSCKKRFGNEPLPFGGFPGAVRFVV
jgi:phage-related protein